MVSRFFACLVIKPQGLNAYNCSLVDFGESHYIGPLHDDNTSIYAGGDTGAVKWVKG